MAVFRITGIWKNNDEIITHYAFHTKLEKDRFTRASKKTKAEAIKLLETPGYSAKTWIWNYERADWDLGEDVIVVNGPNGKFLRTKPDSELTDNLDHLINYDWIAS